MLVYDRDNSHPGDTRKRSREILVSFGRESIPPRGHPLRRLRRGVLRRRAVYAIAAITVLALMFESAAIVVMRR